MFAALIQRSGFDPEARRALRAHHEARLVAMNASAKIAAIEDLLRKHAGEKVDRLLRVCRLWWTASATR